MLWLVSHDLDYRFSLEGGELAVAEGVQSLKTKKLLCIISIRKGRLAVEIS